MNVEPNITVDEAKAVVAAKIFPKVTEESIKAKIDRVSYLRSDHLTICIIHMQNGFFVVGKAAPASPGNYDADVGQRYAYDDAFKQLWPMEGYVLRTRLYEGW